MTDVEVGNDLDLNSFEGQMKKAAAPGAFDTRFGYRKTPVPS